MFSAATLQPSSFDKTRYQVGYAGAVYSSDLNESRLRSTTTRLFNSIEDRKLTAGQCIRADRLREDAVGTLERPDAIVERRGARCALNHDRGGTLPQEAYKMQKDNDDDRNTRQPQHQVTKHRVLLY